MSILSKADFRKIFLTQKGREVSKYFLRFCEKEFLILSYYQSKEFPKNTDTQLWNVHFLFSKYRYWTVICRNSMGKIPTLNRDFPDTQLWKYRYSTGMNLFCDIGFFLLKTGNREVARFYPQGYYLLLFLSIIYYPKRIKMN